MNTRGLLSSLLATILILSTVSGCKKKKADALKAPAGTDQKAKPAPGPPLSVTQISFAGPAGHREDATYVAGETVLCLFTVSNFTYQRRKAHIEADLRVTGPNDMVVMVQPKLVLLKGDAPTVRPDTIRSAAKIPLPPPVPAGRYTVHLTLRDELANRRGTAQAFFTVMGTPAKKKAKLGLDIVSLAADERVPPGALVPVQLSVEGLAAQKEKDGGFSLELTAQATISDDKGGLVKSYAEEPVVKRSLPFAPPAYPLEYQVLLPKQVAPGRYKLSLNIHDKVGKATAVGEVAFSVIKPAFALFNAHVHDAANLPRQSFLMGEQVFVRTSVYGLTVREGAASAAVDLAVVGPDNGVYLARKNAAQTTDKTGAEVAKVGRYPVQIPLILPTLCPRGRYTLLLRARDRHTGREVTREIRIHLRGNPPKPLGRFKIDDLQVRQRADLPPLPGDTFGGGRTYHLTLSVGGMKMDKVKGSLRRATLQGGLKLRNGKGEVVHEIDDLFKLDRTFSYTPLRALIPATWEVPTDLPGGLYNLEIALVNTHDDLVSQMIRRVEIVPPAPAMEVPLP